VTEINFDICFEILREISKRSYII